MGFIVITLWLESVPLGPSIVLSYVGYGPGIQIPTGNYPINETAATIFATHFIDDYRDWANYEWNYQVPADAARFFPLYVPSGNTWEVEVANEYPSGNRTEFLFVKQILGDEPQMVFYTNVTSAYVRPLVNVQMGGLNATGVTYGTPYGSGERHLTIENAAGITPLPLFYDTNSSYVYNDGAFNAKSAAVALYKQDVFDKNLTLNPQYPQPGWFWNYANSAVGKLVEAASLIAIAITIFESKSGGLISKHLKQFRNPPEVGSEKPRPTEVHTPPPSAKALSPSQTRRWMRRHPSPSPNPPPSEESEREADKSDKKDKEQSPP